MIRSFALAATIALLGSSVHAAEPSAGLQDGRTCAPRAEIVALLTDRYSEVSTGKGVSETGDAAFEMFRSPAGSWTITMTTTNGLTCVMAAGRDWREGSKVALLPRS